MSDNNIKLSNIFSDGYGIIPKKLMQSKNISIYEKCILAYMLSFTGAGDTCFPSYKRISEDLKISEPTISKALKKLLGLGYISISKRFKDSLKTNNEYKLLFLGDSSVLNDVKSGTKPDLVTVLNDVKCNNNSINNNNNNNIVNSPEKLEEGIVTPPAKKKAGVVTNDEYTKIAVQFHKLLYELSPEKHPSNPSKSVINKTRGCFYTMVNKESYGDMAKLKTVLRYAFSSMYWQPRIKNAWNFKHFWPEIVESMEREESEI